MEEKYLIWLSLGGLWLGERLGKCYMWEVPQCDRGEGGPTEEG